MVLVLFCCFVQGSYISISKTVKTRTNVKVHQILLFLGRIDPECVCLCVRYVRACVCAIIRKPWLVRVRVTQGFSLSNSPGVIETNGLSFSILLGGSFRPPEGALWCSVGSFRPTPDSSCNLGGYIRPTEKPVCHSPCSTLPDHVTMSRQECFTREQVLQQLFSQQPFSEPEEDAKEPDREANWQGDGEADREADRTAHGQGKRGVLIQVRIHAHRHSGVLHPKEKTECGAPEDAARGDRRQRLRGQETGHRPGLQPQQRCRGQPWQGDRNVQLQEDDCALAPGRLPQHSQRLFLQRLRDMEIDQPRLDARPAEQARTAGKASRDSVHRMKGAHPPHGSVRCSFDDCKSRCRRTEQSWPRRRHSTRVSSLLPSPSRRRSSPARGE